MCCPFKMTAEYKNRKNNEQTNVEDILRVVRSIDSRVEDIHDAMKDHFDSEPYDPLWDHCQDLNKYEY